MIGQFFLNYNKQIMRFKNYLSYSLKVTPLILK